MIDPSKPLYSLTVSEYLELHQKMLDEHTERLIKMPQSSNKQPDEPNDIIFIDEVVKITGYKKATIYSKVCRFEMPVLSRRKPLTFSKSAICKWINDGKPNVTEQKALAYMSKCYSR